MSNGNKIGHRLIVLAVILGISAVSSLLYVTAWAAEGAGWRAGFTEGWKEGEDYTIATHEEWQ